MLNSFVYSRIVALLCQIGEIMAEYRVQKLPDLPRVQSLAQLYGCKLLYWL
jgi:hypothetical protein